MVGVWAPASTSSSVVLPAPFGPTIPTALPARSRSRRRRGRRAGRTACGSSGPRGSAAPSDGGGAVTRDSGSRIGTGTSLSRSGRSGRSRSRRSRKSTLNLPVGSVIHWPPMIGARRDVREGPRREVDLADRRRDVQLADRRGEGDLVLGIGRGADGSSWQRRTAPWSSRGPGSTGVPCSRCSRSRGPPTRSPGTTTSTGTWASSTRRWPGPGPGRQGPRSGRGTDRSWRSGRSWDVALLGRLLPEGREVRRERERVEDLAVLRLELGDLGRVVVGAVLVGTRDRRSCSRPSPGRAERGADRVAIGVVGPHDADLLVRRDRRPTSRCRSWRIRPRRSRRGR